jgi:membrane-associated protease RseP (regulator of RpoE activity)
LSVELGIINLLPVPMLDGGHLFFFRGRRTAWTPAQSAPSRDRTAGRTISACDADGIRDF